MKAGNLSAIEIFGDVVHSYSRAQAIEDGALVDITEMAREVGFRWPVVITRAAWSDCVEWSEEDTKRQTHQDESGRCWDILWMAFIAIKHSRSSGNQLLYQLHRVPRGGRKKKARKTTLKLVTGPGDNGEPVVTILLPTED